MNLPKTPFGYKVLFVGEGKPQRREDIPAADFYILSTRDNKPHYPGLVQFYKPGQIGNLCLRVYKGEYDD